jgi:hypothetical protein
MQKHTRSYLALFLSAAGPLAAAGEKAHQLQKIQDPQVGTDTSAGTDTATNDKKSGQRAKKSTEGPT